MKHHSIRVIDQKESDFLLGISYLENVAKKVQKPTTTIRDELILALNNLRVDSDGKFYEFLIEIISLTFTVYKWGMLLFHIEGKFFGNWILVINFDDKAHIFTIKDGDMLLIELLTQKEVFRASKASKSMLVELLVSIYDKKPFLEIVEFEKDDQLFDGNHIAFDEIRANNQRGEILWIEAEFERYKTRLDELQKLFVESFGDLEVATQR